MRSSAGLASRVHVSQLNGPLRSETRYSNSTVLMVNSLEVRCDLASQRKLHQSIFETRGDKSMPLSTLSRFSRNTRVATKSTFVVIDELIGQLSATLPFDELAIKKGRF